MRWCCPSPTSIHQLDTTLWDGSQVMFFCGWLRDYAPGDRWFVPLFAGFQPILLAVQDCPEASQNQGSYLGLWGPGCFPVGEAYTLSPQRGRDTMRQWVNLGGWSASGVFFATSGGRFDQVRTGGRCLSVCKSMDTISSVLTWSEGGGLKGG